MARLRLSPSGISLILGLLVTVAGISAAVHQTLLYRRLNAMVLSDAVALITAVRRYEQVYNRMPSKYNRYYDVDYGGDPQFPNREVMNVLLARDAEGNRGDQYNPQELAFITNRVAAKHVSGLRGDNEWVDPWGQPYRIVLDTDEDQVCNFDASIHHDSPAIGTRAAMWSNGPDRKSDTDDDILTWLELYRRERRIR